MARKTFVHVLTALSSQESSPGVWVTSVSMRDWDDNSLIDFTLNTPFEILKISNLSLRANLPAELPPEAEISPWGLDPSIPGPFQIFRADIPILYSRQRSPVILVPQNPTPRLHVYEGDYFQFPNLDAFIVKGFREVSPDLLLPTFDSVPDLILGQSPPPTF